LALRGREKGVGEAGKGRALGARKHTLAGGVPDPGSPAFFVYAPGEPGILPETEVAGEAYDGELSFVGAPPDPTEPSAIPHCIFLLRGSVRGSPCSHPMAEPRLPAGSGGGPPGPCRPHPFAGGWL
jgi:hypothetical protein